MIPPTPLELMALTDGELQDPRKSEVERWLIQNPEVQAQQQHRQLFQKQVERAVRHHYDALPNPDLTEDILALIDLESSIETPLQSGFRSRKTPTQSLLHRASTRKVLGVLTLGLAAAAATLLWWKSSSPPHPLKPIAIASAESPPPDVEDDGVVGEDSPAITSIDFGNQSGAIFYVRGKTTTSAVLWIDDTSPPAKGLP